MASIRKLKSGYQYRISVKVNGKFTEKSEAGFRTKKEAQAAAAEMELRIKKGHGVDTVNAADQPFTEYFRNWYEVFRKGKKSPDNDGDIERAIRFAEEHFSGVKLKDLTRAMYQKALNKYGETHTTSSVKKHHTYMRACIRDAMEEGIIIKNPTYQAQPIGKVQPKDEGLKFLSYGDAQLLIDELKSNLQPRYVSRYILLFAIATGARFSEIMGLTWDCVNFDEQTVKIEKTWDYQHTKTFSNTKNYYSKRTITLDDYTCMVLMDLWTNNKRLMKTRRVRNFRNLVFVNPEMQLISNSAVNKTLRNLCKGLGLPSITCHALRHTHASLLLYRKCNIKYISRRLGHTDIVTTLQTYSHIIDEMEQRESQVVNDLMNELHTPNALHA
ncbi:tyrosine-type recombinase/integrase [Shouchella lonarensis]|uniref:Site-specific recombinase XerD n=1 Tax=Shouchella lonarensis TaxID=1464122 RepID=A0A1G6HSA5_9BACI|nr:site-specific integrase [Shouchella lonarensis]SDB97112.1 Site-specific recombinase XerD [Shouchella lonarensis]